MRQQHADADRVRQIKMPFHRQRQRVTMAQASVAAGNVGHAGSDQVGLPRALVVRVDRRPQRPELQSNRRQRHRIGERRADRADIGLDAMRQRVHRGQRRDPHRHRPQRYRIEDRRVRKTQRAAAEQLEMPLLVLHDRFLRHFRFRPRRGRHHDHRQRAAVELAHAGAVAHLLVVGGDDGNALAGAHHRSAADADHAVDALAPHPLALAVDMRAAGIDAALIEARDLDAGLTQRRERIGMNVCVEITGSDTTSTWDILRSRAKVPIVSSAP